MTPFMTNVHSGMVLAANSAAQVGTGEAVAFWILGPLAVIGALGMLFARNAVHSALWLAMTMLSLGAMYLVQQAPFLGFVQIIVYTGAIMMLFLFVLMLVGRESSDSVVEVLRGQRLWAIVLGVGVAGLLVGAVARTLLAVVPAGLAAQNATGPGHAGNVGTIGRLLFTEYLFPFELTSALLITAAVGAMVLTHTRRRVRTQRDMVIARFRGQHARPSPLPGPGVFATADSVATPALLPDGSVAPESLSRLLESVPASGFDGERAQVAGRTSGPDLPAVDAHALTAGRPHGSGSDPANGAANGSAPHGTPSEEAKR